MSASKLTVRRTKGSPGDLMTGANTEIRFDGKVMTSVAKMDIKFRPDDVVRAKVELFDSIVVLDNVIPVFYILDPMTGKQRAVAKITWVDGEQLKLSEVLT